MIDRLKFASRRLAEHLRVAGLAAAGGVYVVVDKVNGEGSEYEGAALAFVVWGAAVIVAVVIDFAAGKEK